MSKYDNEKYYWFKFKQDFFKRHDIKIIKAMPNGKDYVIFYLQLLCESLSHNGRLRFSETIPYDEHMLSIVTDTNIDIVRSAMKLFQQLQLIEILDDRTIYMKALSNLVGSTTLGAERKQIQRQNKAACIGGGQSADICPPELELEKELDISMNERKKKIYKENIAHAHAYEDIMQEFCVSKPVKDKLYEFIKHLKLNNVLMINDRLEKIIVRLDMSFDEDKDKIECIDNAIAGGYKKLSIE